MPIPKPSLVAKAPRTNMILASLPPLEMEILKPHLEAIDLELRLSLYEKDCPIDHVYFMDRGVASLTSSMENDMTVEIATIGREGMVGLPVFLGDSRIAFKAFVQIPGAGWRMAADAFRKAIPRCPTFNHLLLRYALALMNQIAQSAACNRAHSVEERCARWLLQTQDRVDEPSFPLTQEFLGQMLGVRRPTVSIAAGMLAKAGLISYVRGQLTILDRPGLEAAACECYRRIAGEFERLIGSNE